MIQQSISDQVAKLKEIANTLKEMKEHLHDDGSNDWSEFRSSYYSIAGILKEMANGLETNFMAYSYVTEKTDALKWSLQNWCRRTQS